MPEALHKVVRDYCLHCHQYKAEDQFYYGRSTECKACRLHRTKKRYYAKRAEMREQQKKRRLSVHPSGLKQSKVDKLRSDWDMAPEDYLRLINAQQGKCACCQRMLPETQKHIHIDHDHDTGRIRGIVCHGCNLMLGFAENDVLILEAGIAYIQRNKV